LVEPPAGTYRLLPDDAFGLYAVATRTPEGLFGQLPPGTLTATSRPGVFDLHWGGRIIRLIVLGDIAAEPRNAPWEVLSARLERVRHGLRHYHPRAPGTEGLLGQLYLYYGIKVTDMAYTIEDFQRDTRRVFMEHLHELPPDDIQVILEQFPAETRLSGLDPQARLRGLGPQERLRGLDPEEVLSGLDQAVVEAWLKRRGH
jgi:hypothetical protein